MGAETVDKQLDRLRSQLILARHQLQNPHNELERQVILRRVDLLLDRYIELIGRTAPDGATLPS